MSSPIKAKQMIRRVCSKIKTEMKYLSSDAHDSILNYNIEAIKRFSWETVRLELEKNVPTLMAVLSEITTKPLGVHVPLLSFMASMIIKCKHRRLCLVQRAVSVMLYGYGTAKQVNIPYIYIFIEFLQY